MLTVVFVDITTPSLLHSRVGMGEPRAAHCSVMVSYRFLTVMKWGGVMVMIGDPSNEGKQ